MKILYVARHGQHDNADEDAITHALRELGHTVTQYDERWNHPSSADVLRSGPDFLLTHKWDDLRGLASLPCPKVFWFFDLVNSADWELQGRSAAREEWLTGMTRVCDLGFLTDGDWVAADKSGKLHQLSQGADERVMGPWGMRSNRDGTTYPGEDVKPSSPFYWAADWTGDILFTGSVIHGGVRASFVEEMKATYDRRFLAFGHKQRDRVHGRELAELFAAAKVVVAPDGPLTDRYWSNRAYLTMGLGGFLLHPKCDGLRDQGYEQGKHLFYYNNREHLHGLLRDLLEPGNWDHGRRIVAATGYRLTAERHTYRDRCRELVRVVSAKLEVRT